MTARPLEFACRAVTPRRSKRSAQHRRDRRRRVESRGVVFDLDDFDAAFAELDARYLAGEATAHAGTWSVITGSYAAFNRHEATSDGRTGSPSTTGEVTPFAPGNMTPSIRATWDLTPDLSIHIEAVHRLNNSGAVITHHGHGSSQEGFEAEWREIDLLTVEGERINRCEFFDETDLDAALTKFDQLSRPTPRLENMRMPSNRAISGVLRSPRLGRHGRNDGRGCIGRRSSASGQRRCATRSGRRISRTCRLPPTSAPTKLSSSALATRGERLALCVFTWQRDYPRRSNSTPFKSSRSTPTSGSRGCRVRP